MKPEDIQKLNAIFAEFPPSDIVKKDRTVNPYKGADVPYPFERISIKDYWHRKLLRTLLSLNETRTLRLES